MNHCAHCVDYYWDLSYLPGSYWYKCRMYADLCGRSWKTLPRFMSVIIE